MKLKSLMFTLSAMSAMSLFSAVKNETVSFPANGGTKSTEAYVTSSSGVSYSSSSRPEWIVQPPSMSYQTKEGVGTCVFRFTVAANESTKSRSWLMPVTLNGGDTWNITVYQAGIPSPTKYKLTAKPNLTKYGSVTGSGSYASGTKVTLKATAKSGCAFAGWFTDAKLTKPVSQTVKTNINPSLAYKMPAKATTIYAKFITKSADKKALKFTATTAKLAKTARTFTAGKSLSLAIGISSATRTTVTAKSLPAGLTIDSATGKISGTPTKPGKFTATVTVKSAAGNTISQSVKINIKAPADLYGTFNGYALVTTTPAYITFTSDAYGKVSGKVTYKGKAYAFSTTYQSIAKGATEGSLTAKFKPTIKIGTATYKPTAYVEYIKSDLPYTEAYAELTGKFMFEAQKRAGSIKSGGKLAKLVGKTLTLTNKTYPDVQLPKSTDKLVLKFAATDVVKVSGKLKGASVSFSTVAMVYGSAPDSSTGEAYFDLMIMLIEPKSKYYRMLDVMYKVRKTGSVVLDDIYGYLPTLAD